MIEEGKYYICKSRKDKAHKDVMEYHPLFNPFGFGTYNDYLLGLFRFTINDIYYAPLDNHLYDNEHAAVAIYDEKLIGCFKEFEFVLDDAAKELIEIVKKNKYIENVLFKPTCHDEVFDFTYYSCQILLKRTFYITGGSYQTPWCHSIDDQKKAIEVAYQAFRKMTYRSNSLTLALRGTYYDLSK